ncbi:MAG: hypothetical protein AB1489_30630 [Acidobacteriota bacterium]
MSNKPRYFYMLLLRLIPVIIVNLSVGLAPSSSSQAQVAGQLNTQAVRTIDFPRGFLPNSSDNIVMDNDAHFAMITSTETNTVFTFDTKTGKKLGEVGVIGPSNLVLQRNRAATVSLFPKDDFVTLSLIDVSDPNNPRLIINTKGTAEQRLFLSSETTPLAFSKDGRWLFTQLADFELGTFVLTALDSETGNPVGEMVLDDIFAAQIVVQERNGRRLLTLADPSGSIGIIDATDPNAMRWQGSIPLPGRFFSDGPPIVLSETDDIGAIVLPNLSDGDKESTRENEGGSLVIFDIKETKLLAQSPIPDDSQFGSEPAFLMRAGNSFIVRQSFANTFINKILVYELNTIISQPPRLRTQFSLPETGRIALAISPDGKTGFVLGFAGKQLSAFDLESGAVIGIYKTDSQPSSLVASDPVLFTSGETPIFAANKTATEFMILDIINREIQLVSAPRPGSFSLHGKFTTSNGVSFSLNQKVILSKDNTRAYIASRLTDEVMEISLTTGVVLNRIKTSRFPANVFYYEADGIRRLAVTTLGSNSIFSENQEPKLDLFISINGGGWLRTATVGPFPVFSFALLRLGDSEVFFSKDGKTAFIGDPINSVYAFDTDSGERLDMLSTYSDLPFSGRTILFEDSNGKRLIAISTFSLSFFNISLTIIDATDPRDMRVVSVTDLSSLVSLFLDFNFYVFSPDGSKIYYSDSLLGRLITIDVQSGQILSQIDVRGIGPLVPFIQNRKVEYVSAGPVNNPSRILLLEEDPDTGLRVRTSINISRIHAFPIISADGKRGFVPTLRPGSLLAFSTESGKILGDIMLAGFPGQITLLPNNKAIVPEVLNGTNRIFIVDLDNPTALTSHTNTTTEPTLELPASIREKIEQWNTRKKSVRSDLFLNR